jgi:hypothetical protein
MTQEALGSAREKEHQLWEHYGRSNYYEWLGEDRTTAYDLRRRLPAKLALTGGARALFWQAQRPMIGPCDGLLIEYANDSVEVSTLPGFVALSGAPRASADFAESARAPSPGPLYRGRVCAVLRGVCRTSGRGPRCQP